MKEIIALGEEGGAGNLIVSEIALAHFSKKILDENDRVDPFKLDAVGRLGGNWYTRSSGDSLFELEKPLETRGVGVDSIPKSVRDSEILTGNDLGKLGNIEALPTDADLVEFGKSEEMMQITSRFPNDTNSLRYQLHQLARDYLAEGDIQKAWKVLLQEGS